MEKKMRIGKILSALLLSTLLTGCIGSVIGVAVDTTTEVIKAPFAITGTVIGVTAETAGTVIAAPFRMVDAAVGGGHDHYDRRDRERRRDRQDREREHEDADEE
jgi:hypothetical protein|tara:strand:+ start:2096 stop:2407 length:312 start_codon:yes stop_codon:yes gene_type:complete